MGTGLERDKKRGVTISESVRLLRQKFVGVAETVDLGVTLAKTLMPAFGDDLPVALATSTAPTIGFGAT